MSTSEEERLLFWAGRKAAFPAVGRISPDYYCMDGTIPRAKLPLVLKRIRELSEHYGLRVANVFHAGDGNLHPLILYDANKPGELEKTEAFGAEILKLCVEVGGVLTGEHGVGVEKRDLMPAMFTEDRPQPAAAAQMRLRRAGPAQSRQGVSEAAPLRRTGPAARPCRQGAVSGYSGNSSPCDRVLRMNADLRRMLSRAEHWPEDDQEELAQVALEIEARRHGVYHPTPKELAAIDEALAAVERGEIATDDQVEAVFAKYRNA